MKTKNARTPHQRLLVAYALAITLICLTAIITFVTGDWVTPFMALGLGMGFMKKDNDSQVYKTRALPGAASTTVASDGIDLQNTARGDFLANVEVLIEAPALTTTELPDTRTETYDIYHDAESDFSSETILMRGVIIQTGAGGAGADATETRVRLPVDVKRYIRLKITSSASAGDADAKTATFRLVF